jgi:transposase
MNIQIRITKQTVRKLEHMMDIARLTGDSPTLRRIMAVLAVIDGHRFSLIASILKICDESVRIWMKKFLLKGPAGLKSGKPTGRKPKLTKKQKKLLKDIIIKGPSEAGFTGACWRSPMIQDLIHKKFNVFYSTNYISQLLKNMGLSYQKGKFVSDHKDPEKRKKWLEKTWPEIYRTAKEKKAFVLFGDEASFPQWGSLSYTWGERGVQPVVKTSGNRKSYKVFGLIDYFTGRFFFKGHEGRLNSGSYIAFLKEVLSKTRKHIILIQDGASYHRSQAVKEFFKERSGRITVYRLPSYSPDYNPIEKLWKKIKEKEVHLHYFPTFESLKNRVEEGLLRFTDLKNEILSLFVFYNKLSGEYSE